MFILWISMCLQNLIQVHHCLFKLLRKKQNVTDRLRITKGNNKKLAPSPYFSIINVHLMDINVFAKFHEIPSLPFQDIEKLKHCRWTDGHENSIRPPPSNTSPPPIFYFSRSQSPKILQVHVAIPWDESCSIGVSDNKAVILSMIRSLNCSAILQDKVFLFFFNLFLII